jgi:hypothetical protein
MSRASDKSLLAVKFFRFLIFFNLIFEGYFKKKYRVRKKKTMVLRISKNSLFFFLPLKSYGKNFCARKKTSV